jgi:hypothetical protein
VGLGRMGARMGRRTAVKVKESEDRGMKWGRWGVCDGVIYEGVMGGERRGSIAPEHV